MDRQVEYHQEIIPVNPPQIQAVCAAAGRDGWELCDMLPITVQPIAKLLTPGQSFPAQTAVLLQFKRPVGWELELTDDVPDEATVGV